MRRTVKLSRSVRDRAGGIGVNAKDVDRLARVMAPPRAKPKAAPKKAAAKPKASRESLDFMATGLLGPDGGRRR